MNEQWITDRLPNEEDSICGEVIIPIENIKGWRYKTSDDIKLGEPWAPVPTMPPYEEKKTPEQIARETVPDGYEFDERTEGWREMPKGALFYSGDKSWKPRMPLRNGGRSGPNHFYALPVKQYWSKPSDIPADARFFRASHLDHCHPIGQIAQYGVILNRLYEWDGLHLLSWSDRPFDRFEDGKECLVEGGADE